MKIGVITISDTRSYSDDETGQAVIDSLREFGFDTFESVIVADEVGQIRQALRHMSQECQALFTTGGTGFSPRDVTPEATASVLDRRADNLSDLIRARCAEMNPNGCLTRGISGMVGDCLVVNLPGTPAYARHGVQAIGTLLGGILCQLRGDGEHVGVGC